MKKNILLITLFLLGLSTASAQSVGIGLRAGLNLASEYISNNQSPGSSNSTRTGFLLGVYTKFMIASKVGIQPELYYSSTGTTITDQSSSGTITSNYLSLPVFFRYNASNNFHLLVGPQFGILMAAKTTVGSVSVDIKDQFNSTDIGGVVGFGFDFGPFNAGTRYNFGLSNIEKNSFGGEKVRNMVFQIVAGYRLFGK